MQTATNGAMRLFALVAIAVSAARAAGDVPASTPSTNWNYERYCQLVEKTGRNMAMSRQSFDAVQARKSFAIDQTRRFLEDRFGKVDETVIAAFSRVPREFFHYNYERGASSAPEAYERFGTPWPIGYGATISEYKLQCYMTQLGKPRPTDVVLEIGTGSGFQAALFAELVKEVYTIEIVGPLGKAVKDALAVAGYTNVHVRVGDGFYDGRRWKGVRHRHGDLRRALCSASADSTTQGGWPIDRSGRSPGPGRTGLVSLREGRTGQGALDARPRRHLCADDGGD